MLVKRGVIHVRHFPTLYITKATKDFNVLVLLDETEFTIKGNVCERPKPYKFQNYGDGIKLYTVEFKVSK